MATKRSEFNGRSENGKTTAEIVEIEQELKAVNPTIFEGINPKKKAELIQTLRKVSIIEKHHAGPIPDPETLAEYNAIIPNAAERILSMAERQSAHRMHIEDFAVKRQIKQSGRGQIFGFILAILAFILGGYLTILGHEEVGGILLSATLVSLVGLFVVGKYNQKK